MERYMGRRFSFFLRSMALNPLRGEYWNCLLTQHGKVLSDDTCSYGCAEHSGHE